MNNVGRKIRRSMVILVVLFFFPSMGLSTIIDGGAVDGKGLFMIEGGSQEWVKISSTLDMSYNEGAAWGVINGFRVANRLELMGLFQELVYEENNINNPYDYTTEFLIIGGIDEHSSELAPHWYSAGVYDTTPEPGSLMPSTPGYARVEHNWLGGVNDFMDIQISAISGVDTTNYGTGVWLVSDDGDQPPPTVPEPATILLFGIGLLGLAGVSRRKK